MFHIHLILNNAPAMSFPVVSGVPDYKQKEDIGL
jgi:hypothetical protein